MRGPQFVIAEDQLDHAVIAGVNQSAGTALRGKISATIAGLLPRLIFDSKSTVGTDSQIQNFRSHRSGNAGEAKKTVSAGVAIESLEEILGCDAVVVSNGGGSSKGLVVNERRNAHRVGIGIRVHSSFIQRENNPPVKNVVAHGKRIHADDDPGLVKTKGRIVGPIGGAIVGAYRVLIPSSRRIAGLCDRNQDLGVRALTAGECNRHPAVVEGIVENLGVECAGDAPKVI